MSDPTPLVSPTQSAALDVAAVPLEPGTVDILRAGAKTTWTVHETLRKVWQTTA